MIDRLFYKTRAKTNLHGKWIVAALIAVVLMLTAGEEIFRFEMYSGDSFKLEYQLNATSVQDGIDLLPVDNALASFLGRIALPAAALIFIPLTLLIFAAGLALQVFVMGPLSLGAYRYFRQNDLDEGRQDISELLWAFRSPHYRNMVKILFFMTLKLIAWSLLFIIPGIVKSYEYSMIPYILVRNPEMPSGEVFALTRELTLGRKGALFVLDLSFIGWFLVGSIPFGLGVPFVRAYETQTKAGIFNDWVGDTIPSGRDSRY